MWAIFVTYGASLAAALTGGHNAALPGQHAVDIPLSLHSGSSEEVAALQFDVVFDGESLSLPNVTIGPEAQAAEKALEFNIINADTVRVIIVGFNQLAIPDGIIAEAYFDVSAEAAPDVYPLVFDNAFLPDPHGSPISPDLEPGSIEVFGQEGEGEGEGEGEPPACGSLAGPNPGKRSGAADVLVMACTLTALLLAGTRCDLPCRPPVRGNPW